VRDRASDEAALDGRGEAVDLFADDGTWRVGCAGGVALCDERQSDLQVAARGAEGRRPGPGGATPGLGFARGVRHVAPDGSRTTMTTTRTQG